MDGRGEERDNQSPLLYTFTITFVSLLICTPVSHVRPGSLPNADQLAHDRVLFLPMSPTSNDLYLLTFSKKTGGQKSL